MTSKPVHILLVDDDDVDAEAVSRTFRQTMTQHEIIKATNGLEAIKMLRGDAGYDRVPRPYVILLDISMPCMNGHEFLGTIREDDELKSSIVFMLTNSSNPHDITRAYKAHVSGYILKEKMGEG